MQGVREVLSGVAEDGSLLGYDAVSLGALVG